MMDKQVRLGKPYAVKGLAESVSGPGFSAPVGLIEFVLKERKTRSITSSLNLEVPSGKLSRIGKWLRENV